MDTPQLQEVPRTETGMLVRRPAAEVFEAFVDPAITTKFWFTRGSGRLREGAQVRWDWEMYDVSIPVTARAVEPNERIDIGWPGYRGQTTVEWRFEDRGDGTTFVRITEDGFTG